MMAKNKFLLSWQAFLNNAEFPLAFYYTDEGDCTERVPPPAAHMCMIGVLAKARKGIPCALTSIPSAAAKANGIPALPIR